jgi:hypothetical protein
MPPVVLFSSLTSIMDIGIVKDYERTATILNTARLKWDGYQWLQYNGTDITEQMIN